MRDSKESSVKIVLFSGKEIQIWGSAEGNYIPKINATWKRPSGIVDVVLRVFFLKTTSAIHDVYKDFSVKNVAAIDDADL